MHTVRSESSDIRVRVWYPDPPDHAAAIQWLRDSLPPTVELHLGEPAPPRYDVLVAGRPKAEWLTADGLRALIIPWAGLPETTRDAVRESAPDLAVHNLHHNAAATAETAVALLLAAARRLLPADRRLREHDWTPRYNPAGSLQLAGGTALVAGYGAIGQRVARVCAALGMTVHATRRQQTTTADDGSGIRIHPAEELRDLLPRAVALVICLPLTPLTKGLIGQPELASMRNHAVLVNIGRAPIIDESALFHALRDGTIGSAGLDVWYRYPPPDDPAARTHTPPSEFPFHELDNVVMSPHRAGWAPDTDRDRMVELHRVLQAMADGTDVPHRLDLEAGY